MVNTAPAEKRAAVEIETAGQSTALAVPEHLDRYRTRGDANEAERLFAHYPDEIRADGIWLWFFLKTKCNGEHAILAKVAKAIGLRDASNKEPSDNYWYQVATGRYFRGGGDTKAFQRYVAAIRAHARRRDEAGSIPFVDTTAWLRFRDYVDTRRRMDATCKFGGVEGETGTQKTWSAKHYATLNNHLETVYLEAPARATRARFVHKLAQCYLVPDSRSIGEKELAIERFLSGSVTSVADPAAGKARTIIIDNVQRLFRPSVEPDQQPIFNYLHELQDDTGCCVIMLWVPSFRQTITAHNPFWKQFLGRIGGEDEILRMEQRLPKRDLLAFAREFHVADDAAVLPLLRRWADTACGLRVLMHKLEKARLLATRRRSKEITHGHLETVDLEPVNLRDDEREGGES